MATVVRDLMSAPPVTCEATATLVDAARLMRDAGTGSVVVTADGKVTGILTERDLLRAAASGNDPAGEATASWMTTGPDVLGPEEEVGAAWSSLTHHRYRHLPVVEAGRLVGVVSLTDLVQLARLRPAGESRIDVPKGLEGVVVAETSIGDVRGREGFFHYRQYSAVELAVSRSFEDVWFLLANGALPTNEEASSFAAAVRALREMPPGLAGLLPEISSIGSPLETLRTSVSLMGAELGWEPTLDLDAATLMTQALRLGAVVPTILAAAHRLRAGLSPVAPRDDLGHGANYLWMLSGLEPTATACRAIEQYLILVTDHGFNSSTFAARVVTSTGADLAAAIVAAIGALSGPLHGGAPRRALAMLDEIGEPARADRWLRAAIGRGDRIMGFGHRVYKTDDPRSLALRDVALELGGPLVDLAVEVERTVVTLLAELKPGRDLCTNVEFYAGVVMAACGIDREMLTPTFAAARSIGWASHVVEQASDNRLIRPAVGYVGPPAPQPVPTRSGLTQPTS